MNKPKAPAGPQVVKLNAAGLAYAKALKSLIVHFGVDRLPESVRETAALSSDPTALSEVARVALRFLLEHTNPASLRDVDAELARRGPSTERELEADPVPGNDVAPPGAKGGAA